MLLKLLTAPFNIFPWKLFITSLVILSGVALYSYFSIVNSFDWIPSLSAPSTPVTNLNTPYFWNLLRGFSLWLVITVALPFLLVPINRVIFNQQQNQADAILLVSTVSLSGLLATYLFYDLLSLLPLLLLLSLLFGIATYYHFQSLSWLEQRL